MKLAVIFIVLSGVLKEYQCDPHRAIPWGVPQTKIIHLMVRGTDAIAQNFPWNAAIFHKINGNWAYKCGGSLINERFIITVKHCTIEFNSDDPLPVEGILIKFGLQKYKKNNKNFQTRTVSKVYIADRKQWEDLKNDIALVQLAEKVEITEHVLPVLLVEEEPRAGTIGIAVGFGYTIDYELSESLQKLKMPVIDHRICMKRHRYDMDVDQFCAGHTDNRTACNGDSGAGLVFHINGKFYLGGMVSYTEQQQGTFSCKLDGYTVFTSVSNYLPWINRIAKLNVSLTKTVEINSISCGVSRTKPKHPIATRQEAFPGQWPWHANIYHKYRLETRFACGGTLIHERYILTTDYCVIDVTGLLMPVSRIYIHLGVQPTEYQMHITHSVYRPDDEKYLQYRKNIVLMQLSTVVTYTDFVRPVCLPEVDIEIGEFGTAIGYGYTEDNYMSSNLKMVEIPITNVKKCEQAMNIKQLGEDLFCAGYSNGTSVCNVDAGGGIHFKGDNGAWYIGGIKSVTAKLKNSLTCAADKPAGFTNVFMYLPWIESVISSNN